MPSRMRKLIKRCVAHDGAAWEELWQIVVRVAARPVWRLLEARDFSVDHVDDVLQDFYMYLQADDAGCLQNFRGRTKAQFGAYIRLIAIRFTAKRLQKWRHDADREREAMHQVAQTQRRELTEEQIEARRRELRAQMPEEDRRKLDIVSGLASPAEPVPESTIRRWRLEFFRKYSHLLEDPDW